MARQTQWCPCISVVQEAMYKASQGPSKAAMSAQKALHGSETEMRELLGETEENSVSLTRGRMIFFLLPRPQYLIACHLPVRHTPRLYLSWYKYTTQAKASQSFFK